MHEQCSKLGPANVSHTLLGQQALRLVEELQRELDSLRRQLAWSNRLSQLGMLTASLAHETNNLLVPIGSYAQLAKMNPGDASLNERALDAAIQGSAKLSKLVEGVVSLASPIGSEGQVCCRLSEVVEEALVCLQPLLKQHGVEVTSHVQAIQAAIDPLAMEQVFVNLISNAIRAMSSNSVKRQVVMTSAVDGGAVVLRVTDTGPGVPEALRSRLFEPFVSQRNAPADEDAGSEDRRQPIKAKGNGLGLSICKQLIESVGGTIALDPDYETGASFVVRLLQSN